MKVVVKEQVYDDLSEIAKWYELQSPNLGVLFLNEWENTLEYVSDNPAACQIRHKNFRHSKINRFPYLIVFEIENNSVIVYAVIHSRRIPSRRYRRR